MGQKKITNGEILAGIRVQAQRLDLNVVFENRQIQITAIDHDNQMTERLRACSRDGAMLDDLAAGKNLLAWPLGKDNGGEGMLTRNSLADCLATLNRYIEIHSKGVFFIVLK